jgi:hypothetical protein
VTIAKPLPDQSVLLALLRYEPSTGCLFWRARNNPQWDGQFAGRKAFTYCSKTHQHGRIFDTPHLAHRVIWKMIHGDEPSEIDHINGNGFDNRLVNLRAADRTDNMRNMKRSKSNTSGDVGVSYVSRLKRWRAYLGERGKQVHLGYFTSREAAAEVRARAAAARGYHPNHGRASL